MTFPKRMLEDDGDSFRTGVLRSALVLDRPSEASRRKARLALGLGVGTALIGGSTASAATKLTVLAIAKSLLVGVVAGVATIGAVKGVEAIRTQSHVENASVSLGAPSSARIPAPLRSVEVAAATVSAPRATAEREKLAPPGPVFPSAPAAIDPSPEETESAVPAPSDSSLPALPVPAFSVQVPRKVDRAVLTAELAIIDSARRALRQGSPAQALAELDRYDRSYPSGFLRQEAAVVRVEAMAQRGDRAAAAAQASAFQRAYPNSPYAGRVRTALGEGK